MADYVLSAKITGDSSGFEKAFSTAQKAADGFESKMRGVASKVNDIGDKISGAGKKLSVISAGFGAANVAGIKYNATVEQLQTSFTTMTGSADDAADIVGRLQKIGAETPFEFTDLADTTQLLMNFGFTADGAIESMQMLGDISQGSAEKMGSIARAYGKMSSAGKVSLEDINMMIDAGFNPLQEISESTGESMKSLYKRITKGTISVDEITASMQRSTAEGGKYFQSMQAQSKTFSGQMSTLSDNANTFLGNISSGIFEKLAQDVLPKVNDTIAMVNDAFASGGFQGAVDAIKTISPVLDTVITKVEAVAGKLESIGINPAMFAGALVAAGPLFVVLGKVVSTASGMIATIGKVGGVLASIASPIGIVVAAITALAAGFAYMMTTNEAFREKVIGIWQSIQSAVGPIIDAIKDKCAEIFNGIGDGSALKGISETLQDVLSNISIPVMAFGSLFAGTLAKFNGPLGALSTKLLGVGKSIATGMGGAISRIIPSITSLFSKLNTGGGVLGIVKTGLSGLGGAVSSLFNPVTLIVGAIALLVAGFTTLMATNEGFRNTIVGLGQNIISSLLPAIQTIVQTVTQVISTVFPVLMNVFNQLLPIIGQISIVIMQVAAAIAPMITQLVSALLPVITNIVTVIANVIESIMPALVAILNVVMSVIQAIIPVVTNIVSVVVDAITNIISAISPIVSFIGGVISAIMAAITPIVTFVANIIATVIQVIGTIVATVTGIFSTVYGVISSAFQKASDFVSKIINAISKVISTLTGIAGRVFNGIYDTVHGVMTNVGNFISGVFDGIQSAWNGLTSFVGGIFDGVSSAVGALVDTVKGFVNDVIGGINWAVDLINLIPGVSIGYIPYLLHGTDDWSGGFARMNEGGRGELTYLPNGTQVIPHDISVKYAKESARANSTRTTENNTTVNNTEVNLNGNYTFRDHADMDYLTNQLALKVAGAR